MTEFEKSILVDITKALLPKTENLSVSVSRRENFGEELETYMEDASEQISLVVRLSLFLIQILPIFYFLSPFSEGYPLPFTRLSEKKRTLFLEKMNESSFYVFRGMLTLLRTIILQNYCSGDEVKKEIDYQVDLSGEKNPLPTLVEENIFELESPQKNFEIECEVIVIGSGAGGAVIAKELAEKGFEVAVLEEGFRHSSEKFNGKPLDMFPLLYRNSGTTTTFPLPSLPLPPIIPLPIGECLGGTTVVNSSTCYRTPDHLLENWTEEGLKDLSPEDMKPFFEKVEDNLSVHPVSLELMGEANAKTMQGANSLGYETEPLDKNASGCDGTGVCQYGCPMDAKKDMQTTYVRWGTQAGAKFYTGFKAKWLIRKEERIEKVGGVMHSREGEKLGKFVVNPDVVVLAAGAIHTPYLLLKNRIANSSNMVGMNLKIHPCVSVTGFFSENLYGWKGVSQSTGITEFFNEGLTLEGSMPPPFGASIHPGVGEELSEIIGNWKKASVLGIMIAENDSLGSVQRLPEIFPVLGGKPLMVYKIGEKDKNKAIEGIARACRIYLASGAEKVSTGIIKKPWITSEEEIDEILGMRENLSANDLIWTAYHPQGTCRMAEDPNDGVINSYCQSHDIKNLFISDASIFPESIHVNPQISIMAFATRCAEYISRFYSEGRI